MHVTKAQSLSDLCCAWKGCKQSVGKCGAVVINSAARILEKLSGFLLIFFIFFICVCLCFFWNRLPPNSCLEPCDFFPVVWSVHILQSGHSHQVFGKNDDEHCSYEAVDCHLDLKGLFLFLCTNLIFFNFCILF